ncbi:MAG: spore cortex biosynthesis protein YabQ [Oscillospiraceae bacterium]|nr:spore cortex biosynthesis protein YabQ [Oscillospiraceae bacterium]
MFQVPHIFQISVFFKSIGLGALIGILYFFFIILRRSGLSKTAVVVAQDIVFFCAAAVISFMFIFEVNAGETRFFIFAGEVMGFCLIYIFPLKPLASFYYKISKNLREKAAVFFAEKKRKKSEKKSKKLLHKN